MQIPTEFELGGVKWNVVLRKRLKGKYGDCNIEKQEIRILDTLLSEVKEQTFCHELTHAILMSMGKNPDDHNEEFIDGFATFLHQYLKTAK